MQKRSLYLDPDHWDITLDTAGNIKTCAGRYCDAQNVANAVRLFTNDAYLDQSGGVPHFEIDLGHTPAYSEIQAAYRRAALTVENIAEARVDLDALDAGSRSLTGVIYVTNEQGEGSTIEI